MKKSYLLWIVITALFLTGCAPNRALQTQANPGLVKETWMNQFHGNPRAWTAHVADRWFYSDFPNTFKQYAPDASPNSAITAAEVRVPNFSRIKVEGPYLVQLYGATRNTVFILGANDQVRHTQVEIRGDALYIRPATDCNNCGTFKNVIVRIGIRNLDYLYHAGSGLVEGKNIRSHCLVVKSSNSGNVLLTGNMNVTNVVQGGRGTISLIGVYSPTLAVNVLGDGNLNLSGHIGVSQIIKRGFGCLTILGVDTDGLTIDANNGLTTLTGTMNIQRINMGGLARVFAYWVTSNGLNITLHDSAHLGLAGNAQDMNVVTYGKSRFDGKCMHGNNMYVNSMDNSHANISPERKLFADAKDYSSIYFFSSPNVVSRFNQGYGLVLPIFNDRCTMCAPSFVTSCRTPVFKAKRRRSYKSYKAERPVCKTYKEVRGYHGERPYKIYYKKPKTSAVTTTTTTVTHSQPTYQQYKAAQSR